MSTLYETTYMHEKSRSQVHKNLTKLKIQLKELL